MPGERDRRVKLLIALLAFMAGFVVARLSTPTGRTTEQHWEAVDEFLAHLRDPANYRVVDSSGLAGATVPFDIEPHLAALVSAGELEHVDIVLPLVPASRETSLHWMRFTGEHPDIVWAIGNPSVHPDSAPSGEPPLHLNLWFKETARADVGQLIRELEALPAADMPVEH